MALWCIKVPGADLFAMESLKSAELAAERHNAAISKWYETQKETQWNTLPPLASAMATVELWPYGKKEHEESLAEQALDAE